MELDGGMGLDDTVFGPAIYEEEGGAGDPEDDALPIEKAEAGSVAPAVDVAGPTVEELAAANKLRLPWGCGYLTYYRSHDSFYAVCKNGCRFNKKRNRHPWIAEQGRPLGVLCAWLQGGCDDKEHHTSIVSKLLTHERRVAARAEFAKLEAAAVFLRIESKAKPGEEGGEPLVCP